MIKVSVISYLNSLPFIYGLKQSNLFKEINLSVAYPSKVAEQAINNTVDIALVPVVVLNQLESYEIITDYCIGSESSVDSVCLYSFVPINEINTIYLDYQSRTSVELLKLLLRDYWNLSPKLNLLHTNESFKIKGRNAALVIGDRSFVLKGKYPYVYDLAEIWNTMTKLPFVFACWISTRRLPVRIISEFNEALGYGVDNISQAIQAGSLQDKGINYEDYLNKKISYNYDDMKKRAMKVFLERVNPKFI
jgi:chorismate dehydratase